MFKYNNDSVLHNLTTEEKTILFLMAIGFKQEKISSILELEFNIYGRTRSILQGKTKLNGSLDQSTLQLENLEPTIVKQLHYNVNGALCLPHPNTITPEKITLNIDPVMDFYLGKKIVDALSNALPHVDISIKINDSNNIQSNLSDEECCGGIYPPNHKTLNNTKKDHIILPLIELERVLSAHPDNPIFNKPHVNFGDLDEYKFMSINAYEAENTDLYLSLREAGYSHEQALEKFSPPIKCIESARARIRLNNEIVACNRTVMRKLGVKPLLNNALHKRVFKTPELNEVRYEFGRTPAAAKYWPVIARTAILLFTKEKHTYS